MAIEFKKIRWRNFLSTGNQFNEIELNTKKVTLISGVNGSGKSTLLDALTFGLYSKAYRGINKPQLINSTNNKDCLVEVEFNAHGKECKVVRGIKPNIFEIYQDGKLLDQLASANDQQKYLENVILKLNYKSFTQIAIIGSSNFVPFMQLPTAHRREVIEDLLDIAVFSSMNVVIKDKIKLINQQVTTSKHHLDTARKQYDMQKDHILSVEREASSLIDEKREKINNHNIEIQALKKKEDNLLLSLNEFVEVKDNFSAPLREHNTMMHKINAKRSELLKVVDFYDTNETCPTCKSVIDENHKKSICDEIQQKNSSLEKGLEDLKTKIANFEKQKEEFETTKKQIQDVNNKIQEVRSEIKWIERQILNDNKEIESIESKFKNQKDSNAKLLHLEKEVKQTELELDKLQEEVKHNSFIAEMLKDGGIKTNIIKKYLPVINSTLNEYLKMFELYVNFVLDSEFKESIKSNTQQDYSYSSFSEGEKGRLDISLLFTWREIARHKNSANTNLLILDECFSGSLDATGKEILLQLIRFKIPNTNSFVIDHSLGGEDREKFDRTIEVTKSLQGFSKLAIG